MSILAKLIICLEIYIIDTEAIIENRFYRNKFETNHENNPEFEVAGNKLLLPGFCLAKYYIPEDIVSMIEFNTMCYSLSAKPVSTIADQKFLTSVANWKRRSEHPRYLCKNIRN